MKIVKIKLSQKEKLALRQAKVEVVEQLKAIVKLYGASGACSLLSDAIASECGVGKEFAKVRNLEMSMTRECANFYDLGDIEAIGRDIRGEIKVSLSFVEDEDTRGT